MVWLLALSALRSSQNIGPLIATLFRGDSSAAALAATTSKTAAITLKSMVGFGLVWPGLGCFQRKGGFDLRAKERGVERTVLG